MLDLNKKNHSKQNMIKHSEIQNGRLSVSNNKTINNKHIKQNNEKGLSTNERRICNLNSLVSNYKRNINNECNIVQNY